MTEFYDWQDDISDHEGGSCLVRIATDERDEAWLLDATFPGDAEAEEAKALILAALEQADAMRAALKECIKAYEAHRDEQPTGHLWPDPNHIHNARRAIAAGLPEEA